MAEQTEKRTPTDGMPASANDHLKATTNKTIRQDTMVFYRTWFECLRTQGRKYFLVAIIALFEYAFYGVEVKTANLPPSIASIVSTFTPIIDSNEKKRKGGAQGAKYGDRGGRPSSKEQPKTPLALDLETPKGLPFGTPKELDLETPYPPANENGKVYKNDNGDVDKKGNGITTTSPHQNYQFFKEIFFFRNCASPAAEAQKFCDHYRSTNWQLSGGEFLSTDAARLQAAWRWKIVEDKCNRFDQGALQMWRILYEAAPIEIRPLMLANDIAFQKTATEAIITCPSLVVEWLEKNAVQNGPIVKQWSKSLKINVRAKVSA